MNIEERVKQALSDLALSYHDAAQNLVKNDGTVNDRFWDDYLIFKSKAEGLGEALKIASKIYQEARYKGDYGQFPPGAKRGYIT